MPAGRWEKFWQRSMALAFPCMIVSLALDPTLRQTLIGLWDDPTALRLLFFSSSALLFVGLARNSSRLRQLAERRPLHGESGRTPRR